MHVIRKVSYKIRKSFTARSPFCRLSARVAARLIDHVISTPFTSDLHEVKLFSSVCRVTGHAHMLMSTVAVTHITRIQSGQLLLVM